MSLTEEVGWQCFGGLALAVLLTGPERQGCPLSSSAMLLPPLPSTVIPLGCMQTLSEGP